MDESQRLKCFFFLYYYCLHICKYYLLYFTYIKQQKHYITKQNPYIDPTHIWSVIISLSGSFL